MSPEAQRIIADGFQMLCFAIAFYILCSVGSRKK